MKNERKRLVLVEFLQLLNQSEISLFLSFFIVFDHFSVV